VGEPDSLGGGIVNAHARALIVAAIAAFACASATREAAALTTYNVNSVADVPDAALNGICETALGNGVCTLRAAVMEADSGPNPGDGVVTINIPAGTFKLTRAIGVPDNETNGDLNLRKFIRLQGTGWGTTIIDANNVDRAFMVEPFGSVTFADLSIQGGRPPNNDSRPGGPDGGGIVSTFASVTLLRCLVRDNHTLQVNGSGGGNGGGVHAYYGSITVIDSVLRINLAAGSFGGGGISGDKAAISIVRSTLNLNTSGGGGGVYAFEGTVNITNSTLSQNSGLAGGGGLWLHAVTGATVNNVTIAGNTTTLNPVPSGGGIYLYGGSSLALSNCIVKNTGKGGAPDDLSCPTSSVVSNGHNMIFSAGCPVTGAYSTANPFLYQIADNGGTTLTHAVSPISQAVNAGSGCTDAVGATLTTDQRGVTRPLGSSCDLGAVELEPVGDANGDGLVSVLDVFLLINHLFAGGPLPPGRGNVNGDSFLSVQDVFSLINYLFAGGPAPVYCCAVSL
jgi:hypothetical protein